MTCFTVFSWLFSLFKNHVTWVSYLLIQYLFSCSSDNLKEVLLNCSFKQYFFYVSAIFKKWSLWSCVTIYFVSGQTDEWHWWNWMHFDRLTPILAYKIGFCARSYDSVFPPRSRSYSLCMRKGFVWHCSSSIIGAITRYSYTWPPTVSALLFQQLYSFGAAFSVQMFLSYFVELSGCLSVLYETFFVSQFRYFLLII